MVNTGLYPQLNDFAPILRLVYLKNVDAMSEQFRGEVQVDGSR